MSQSRRALFLLLAAAALVGAGAAMWLDWRLAVIVASNGFFIVYLCAALSGLDRLNEHRLKKAVAASNTPAYIIFLITLGTVGAALASLFMTINAEADVSSLWLALALLSVPLGWATLHMMAAFHYAYLYWSLDHDGASRKGLEFPGAGAPDGWDFVYFAFVIGIAAQTADVAISGRALRRFALAHSIVAYFFNAVLVAAAVNVAVASK